MTEIMEWIGPLSVEQRTAMGLAGAAIAFLVVVGVLAIFLGWLRSLGVCVALVALAVVALFLMPLGTSRLVSHPAPAADYEAAMKTFETELLPSSQPLNPLCDPYVLSHGEKTKRVVVLLHGVSSCPHAYVDFAPLLHERGDNVLVVRMPQNGYADRASDTLGKITAEELAEFADKVVDTAAGLGDEVVFLGISAGGTIAGWVAQNRSDVDRAVLVAPFFGLGGTGPWTNSAAMRAMLVLPDFTIWKDPAQRENFQGGMAHAYVRQSTRGTGQIMRLGEAVAEQAAKGSPAAGDIVVVMNDADTAVSNRVTDRVVDRWIADGADVTSYTFPAKFGLGHEIIDPEEPGADPSISYPVLLQLIDDPSAFDPAAVPMPMPEPAAAPATPAKSAD
ncbi:alpha/beta hydrolase [Acuticoccus sediminis]|uniref:Alpha/beta hydrolase n=1 Tax=Acuticoccus sediminis TaxID=2184697 RepID=A0A8B2NPX1_9HYPH|nr:alpha/beta fold hydrolase [Acuticoccus sediminis]RAH98988.1 alpha/beta hydrolase [Acuticoccus sediminis]